VNLAIFDWSWRRIGFASVLFVILFITTLYRERGRILSAFEREATIKAARSYWRRR
jgi:hypothetical protein